MDSSHNQDDRTPAQWLDIDDDTLRSRISLATEMMLTSGIISAEDVARGWFDKPEPEEQTQRFVITLGLMVILNGVHGAPIDAIVDAWEVTRLLEGAVEAMLTAVEVIRSEGA